MKIREAFSQFKALAGIMHGSRAFGGPYQVNLSMTRRCNIRCIHCFFHSPLLKTENMFQRRNAKTPKEELSDEKLIKRSRLLDADGTRTKELIHELVAMGTRQFTFTGDEEPYRRFRRRALQINTGRGTVPDCDCDQCPHYIANLKVYKRVHPVKGQLLAAA